VGKAVDPAPLAEQAADPLLPVEYPAVLLPLGSQIADPPLLGEYTVASAPPGPLVVGPAPAEEKAVAPSPTDEGLFAVSLQAAGKKLEQEKVASTLSDR